jgi:hypothetical protein
MLDDLDNAKKEIQEYLEVKLDLIKLQAAESLSRILSSALSMAIIFFLLFLILLFISIGAGFFFASYLQSSGLGFLCVAGFYIVLLIIILLFRKKIIERPVIRSVVKLSFSIFGDHEKK